MAMDWRVSYSIEPQGYFPAEPPLGPELEHPAEERADSSGPPTEESAITGCGEFGQRIIDGRVRNCSVDDLS